jgi:hypothetical protein
MAVVAVYQALEMALETAALSTKNCQIAPFLELWMMLAASEMCTIVIHAALVLGRMRVLATSQMSIAGRSPAALLN